MQTNKFSPRKVQFPKKKKTNDKLNESGRGLDNKSPVKIRVGAMAAHRFNVKNTTKIVQPPISLSNCNAWPRFFLPKKQPFENEGGRVLCVTNLFFFIKKKTNTKYRDLFIF